MSFAQPIALSLLAAALLVVLLSLLRTRRLQRDVSALFIWETLRDATAARTQILRRLFDPLLLLQLALLIALVLALAQPLWTSRSPAWARLAIVVDSSASMRTVVNADGGSRFRAAIRSASDLASDASSFSSPRCRRP
jgi:Ca-activated chloride channel family protein